MYVIATSDFKRILSPSYSFVQTTPKFMHTFSYNTLENVNERLTETIFELNNDGSIINCNKYRMDDLVICEVIETSKVYNGWYESTNIMKPVRHLTKYELAWQYRSMVATEFARVLTNGSSVFVIEPYIDELDDWAIQQYFQSHVNRLPNFIVIIPELFETYGDDTDENFDEKDSNIIKLIRKDYNFTLSRIRNPDTTEYSDIGFFSAHTLAEVTAASLALKKMPYVINLETVYNAMISEMTEIPYPIEFSKIRNIRQYL